MTLNERKAAFNALGQKLQSLLDKKSGEEGFENMLRNVYFNNKWFDELHTRFMLSQIAEMLKSENLEKWLDLYDHSQFNPLNIKSVGVIMAGNIPLVGFHDFLCVLISGHIFIGKLSSQDHILLPYISDLLVSIDERFNKFIFLKEDLRDGFDAVIATGSNNSSRYFEYYFAKYPNIIRNNRNSLAVLNGFESPEQLDALADDICLYFGKGCRSVSKIYIPQNYNFDSLIQSFDKYNIQKFNTKYFNNYEYYKSIYIINNLTFIDNGFLLLREDMSMSSPVSVLHYEFYSNLQNVNEAIVENHNNIQCVVSEIKQINNSVKLGHAQKPVLWDYADNVDTLEFLFEI